MTESRQDTLAKLIGATGWRIGAELGIWRGETLFHLLHNFPLLHMIGVDRWQRVPGPPKDKTTGLCNWAEKDMEGAEDIVRQKAKIYEQQKRLTILKMDTIKAARYVDDASLDFVFIDADHSTAAVMADIEAWRPKIKAGGGLLGHDADWPSVQRALEQSVGKWQTLPGNVWISEKHD